MLELIVSIGASSLKTEGGAFRVAYDILQETTRFTYVAAPLVMACGILAWGVILRRSVRKGSKTRPVLVVAGLTLWVLMTVVMANPWIQHARCVAWAENGDYSTLEGVVSRFAPMPSSGHGVETFTVGDSTFAYSQFDDSTGAFNRTAAAGGPMHEGLYVRVHHHGGRILKIEIREPTGDSSDAKPDGDRSLTY